VAGDDAPHGLPFEDLIAQRLNAAHIPFHRDALLQGLIVDFLIRRPGTRIVIEAKAWVDPVASTSRALHQAALIKELTGVDRVFIAIAGLQRSDRQQGLLAADDVGPAVADELDRRKLAYLRASREPLGYSDSRGQEAQAEDRGVATPKRRPAPKKRLFVAMPLHERFDDAYYVGIAGAAKLARVFAKRIDQDRHTSDIVLRIKETIHDFDGVIADLTEANPNVLFEVGYARALGKPVFQISSDPLANLPFDVRNDRTLPYALGRTHQLRLDLAKDLRSAF